MTTGRSKAREFALATVQMLTVAGAVGIASIVLVQCSHVAELRADVRVAAAERQGLGTAVVALTTEVATLNKEIAHLSGVMEGNSRGSHRSSSRTSKPGD